MRTEIIILFLKGQDKFWYNTYNAYEFYEASTL